jgi:coatomer protein complex subunit gamma
MDKGDPPAAPKPEKKEINTSAIVHKSKAFREVTLDMKKCRQAMIAILQALAQDARFTERERTELFFSLTQLFHNKDRYIHRLLLLLLKQIPVNSHDSIIITHSLSKDISGNQVLPQGHAIRTLFAIIDPSNVLSLERYLKLQILSQNACSACSALCGAIRLLESRQKDAVLRWKQEIRQASKSSCRSVRCHALRLLFALTADDPYAAAALAANLDEPRSQLEQCVAIAISAQALRVKPSPKDLEFLNSCLISGSPIVRLEAARRATPEMLPTTVDILAALMNGSVLRVFAAVRTIAESKDQKVYVPLLPKILDLMRHPNGSLAATAALCVLKLGNESHVELSTKRILAQCRKWAAPLLRSVAEEACRFAGRFRNEKLTDVAVFLLRVTKDPNEKFAILRALLTNDEIPRASLLPRLAEYLEDWDSASIARRICDFIAGEVAQLEDPGALVPVLFNRIVLDIPAMRIASVNTLAAIASGCKGMKETIVPLLQLFALDEDAMVREEVILFLNALRTRRDLSDIFTPFSIEEELPPLDGAAPAPAPIEESEAFVPPPVLDELAVYGPLRYKSDAIDLTEPSSEFVVSYFVNLFEKHIVFEFLCTNTVENIHLVNVSVALEDLTVVRTIAAHSIKYQQTASMWSVVERDRPTIYGRFKAVLVYSQADDDHQEEWSLESVALDTRIWVARAMVNGFDETWATLQQSQCIVIGLPSLSSVAAALSRLEQVLGMEKVSEEKDKRKLTVKFSGQHPDGGFVLIMAQLGMSNRSAVCKLMVASASAELSEEILQAISF